jgi:hypothetical protein
MQRSIAMLALTLLACGGAQPVAPEASPSPPAPVVEVIAPPEAEPAAFVVEEIALDGDGRVVPIALAAENGAIALAVMSPEGIVRFSVALETGTVTPVDVTSVDRYPTVAEHDPAHGRLWWATPLEQARFSRPSARDFPVADAEVTTSTTVAHSLGLRAELRVCPVAPVGRLDTLVDPGAARCDHQVSTILPVGEGVVLGGLIAERFGAVGARAWIGLLSGQGALVAEHRLDEGIGEGWVGALASSPERVLAVLWAGHGDGARVTFRTFHPETLATIASAPRITPSYAGPPWSSAVAAPDGSFWIALPTTDELAIVTVGPDGSIAGDHPIEGAALPITSTQTLAVRSGEPWLMITEPYAEPEPVLRVARIDPTTGHVLERHAITLPHGFHAARMIAIESGFVLAGRIGVERPLVLWITPPPG